MCLPLKLYTQCQQQERYMNLLLLILCYLLYFFGIRLVIYTLRIRICLYIHTQTENRHLVYLPQRNICCTLISWVCVYFSLCLPVFLFLLLLFIAFSLLLQKEKLKISNKKINNEQNNRINFRRWFYISLFQFTLLDWHSALERAERFRTLVPRKLAYSRDCLLCVRFLSTEWDLHTAIHSLEVRYRRRRCWRRSKRRSLCVV